MEIHHAYTLVHDDLPCMDDDAVRRGRPSTHRQFGEWQALLAGDGLSTLSYRALSLIKSPQLPRLLRYTSWALGPKGLIGGQHLDLSGEMTRSFSQLMATHKLKTSRLMQVALVGSGLLTEGADLRTLKTPHRLGEYLGISFQLLDDLGELGDEQLPARESQINSFLVHGERCEMELRRCLEGVVDILDRHQLRHTKKVVVDYLHHVSAKLSRSESLIKERAGESLGSVQQILHRLGL